MTFPLQPIPVRDSTPEMAQAFALLLAMTDSQRARIFCWFCWHCSRYVGPGDWCSCARDE